MRLTSATVLLALVYMTNGLAESGENYAKMSELVNRNRSNDLPIKCLGDWNTTPEKMKEPKWCAPLPRG